MTIKQRFKNWMGSWLLEDSKPVIEELPRTDVDPDGINDDLIAPPEFGLELMPMVFPVQTRMFARLNFFKVTLRSMWEDYSDFISNFRDDLEEPYILPDEYRFTKMCKTGTLGDYLGLPTFGTRISSSVKLTDAPCATNSRAVSDTPLLS